MASSSSSESAGSGFRYPYPSTLNPATFISIKLSGTHDYLLWETQMLCLFESQELVGFIDGTVLPPPETIDGGEAAAGGTVVVANEEYRLWKRTDRLVKSWILSSLEKNVLATTVGLSTAKSVWTKLLSTFGPNPQENKEEEIEEELPAQQGVKYPYPSTFNVANFVTIKLSKLNYDSWILQILSLVDSLELRDFLMYEEPPSLDNYLLWRRTDMLLRGWILGSISEDVITEVFNTYYFSTSRSIVLKIENIFVLNYQDRYFLYPTPVATEIESKEEQEERIELDDISVIEYRYLFTFNVANILIIKLTKANYELWVGQIWSLVDILEMRHFLVIEQPFSMLKRKNQLWKRTDKLLRGWILATLSEDILKIVFDFHIFDTSRKVMIKIEETFVEDINKRSLSPKPETTYKEKSIRKCTSLYEATLAGDWEATKRILDGDKEAATDIILENNFTVLHVAVVTGKHIPFLENLVQYLPPYGVLIETDESHFTALHVAAMIGNTEAAKILMKRNPTLISMRNSNGKLPLNIALDYEHKDTYSYLLSVILSIDDHYLEDHASGLLSSMIISEYFDLALDLVKRYPHALEGGSSLCWIAEMASCFRSGISLNFLESFIYSCVPVKFENYNDMHHKLHFLGGSSDIENPANNTQTLLHHGVHFLGVLCNKLKLMLWDAILLVPSIKIIRQKKLAHHQAVQLVKCLCEALKSSNDEASFHSRSSKALTTAARFGTLEVVEEILRILPHTIWSHDESEHTISEIAVINRCEKVFNISYQMNELQEYLKFHTDDNDNSILHLAGGIAPQHKLNLVSGAALQMQRELQWFKEVEKLSNPYLKTCLNSSKETPAMVFTREHKELVIEGEKWMKDTANSCTIAAALIITVVFAAAITVPGGNKDDGSPVFNNPSFLIFAVSDTISLFMSTTSLLMFLSILTTRYAEHDFLHALPKRLVFGLLTLFLSITSMVIAFSSAVYLVFGGGKEWVIIPLVALSFLSITSFVRLQSPLLIDVYSSTYGHGYFGK